MSIHGFEQDREGAQPTFDELLGDASRQYERIDGIERYLGGTDPNTGRKSGLELRLSRIEERLVDNEEGQKTILRRLEAVEDARETGGDTGQSVNVSSYLPPS